MRIPGFGDRDSSQRTTTTTVDPATGDRVHHVDERVRHVDTLHGTRERTAFTDATPGDRQGRPTVDPTAGAITARELQRETHDAYERGRKDERKARQNHPILTILVVLLAILGLTLGFLALRERSFEGAGRVFDRWVGFAAVEAQQTGRVAQDAAGEAAQDAGAAVQATGATVERDAEANRR